MGVTVDDIYSKQFIEKNGGYDPDDVDNFLNDIMDEMTLMQQENESLRKQLEEAKVNAERADAATKNVNSDETNALKEQVRQLQDNLRRCDQERSSLQSTVKSQNQQIESLKNQPVKAPVSSASETLETILVNAQKLADEAVSQAQDRARGIVDNAQAKADKILGDARGEKDLLSSQIADLRKTAEDYRDKFRDMLTSYMSMLDHDEFLK